MRILLLTQYYPPEVGAAQTRLGAVVRELVRFGDEVEVVTALPNYPNGRILDGYRGRLMRSATEATVRVRRLWMYAAMGTGARRLASYFSFAVTCNAGLLRARRPDVLVVESPPLFVAAPGIVWARLRRVPVVVNVADLWPDAAVALGALQPGRVLDLMHRLERWIYRRASIVSTVTDGVRERLIAKGVPAERLVMLVNGVDVDLFRPDAGDPSVLAQLDLPRRSFVVYAGTMGLAHDLWPLLDAAAQVQADPTMPYLLLLGGGSERPALAQAAHARGLDNVVFRDPIPPDQLAQLLPLAEAGVVTLADTPINEAVRPAKLLPLMAAGLPVLFAGRGEGVKILGGAGVAVENRADAIADALRRLHADPEMRAQMAALGRRAAVEQWSWSVHVGRWRAAVHGVTERLSRR